MKRSIWWLSVALLAVAAIEFVLLGAASAGASFVPSWLGARRDAPPAVRQGKTPTPAPTPVSPPVSPPSCLPDQAQGNGPACDQQPASIQLTPDPLAIHCDGVERSTLTVRVTDAKGRPVPDGTTVYFGAYNGTTTPSADQTRKGVASTSVVFYSDIFPRGPNLIVDVGPLEAGVRIRCFPASDQRPPSPPPCAPSPPSVSPPCVPPPTPTPLPSCSPPSLPQAVSPPCPTPTATPVPLGPDSPYQTAIDADPATPGVQSTISIAGNAPFTLGINVTRVGATPYLAYQNEFEFPSQGLALDGTVRENSSATGLLACVPYGVGTGILSPADTLVGRGGGCRGSIGDETSFVGEISSFTMHCLADGTFALALLNVNVDPFGSTLMDSAGRELATGTTGATVTCVDVQPPTATSSATAIPTNTPCPGACPTATVAPTPAPNVMALDADSGVPGLQASRTVSDLTPFSLDIDVLSVGATPYKGYQWEIEFPTAGLAFADTVVEHRTETGLPLCAAPHTAQGVVSPLDTVVGVGAGCIGATLNPATTYVGPVTTFELRCLESGSFPVLLLNLAQDRFFGTTLLDEVANTLDTQTQSITINCLIAP